MASVIVKQPTGEKSNSRENATQHDPPGLMPDVDPESENDEVPAATAPKKKRKRVRKKKASGQDTTDAADLEPAQDEVSEEQAIAKLRNKPAVAAFAPEIRLCHFIGDGPEETPFTDLFGFDCRGLSVEGLEYVTKEVVKPFHKIKSLREQARMGWSREECRLEVSPEVAQVFKETRIDIDEMKYNFEHYLKYRIPQNEKLQKLCNNKIVDMPSMKMDEASTYFPNHKSEPMEGALRILLKKNGMVLPDDPHESSIDNVHRRMYQLVRQHQDAINYRYKRVDHLFELLKQCDGIMWDYELHCLKKGTWERYADRFPAFFVNQYNKPDSIPDFPNWAFLMRKPFPRPYPARFDHPTFALMAGPRQFPGMTNDEARCEFETWMRARQEMTKIYLLLSAENGAVWDSSMHRIKQSDSYKGKVESWRCAQWREASHRGVPAMMTAFGNMIAMDVLQSQRKEDNIDDTTALVDTDKNDNTPTLKQELEIKATVQRPNVPKMCRKPEDALQEEAAAENQQRISQKMPDQMEKARDGSGRRKSDPPIPFDVAKVEAKYNSRCQESQALRFDEPIVTAPEAETPVQQQVDEGNAENITRSSDSEASDDAWDFLNIGHRDVTDLESAKDMIRMLFEHLAVTQQDRHELRRANRSLQHRLDDNIDMVERVQREFEKAREESDAQVDEMEKQRDAANRTAAGALQELEQKSAAMSAVVKNTQAELSKSQEDRRKALKLASDKELKAARDEIQNAQYLKLANEQERKNEETMRVHRQAVLETEKRLKAKEDDLDAATKVMMTWETRLVSMDDMAHENIILNDKLKRELQHTQQVAATASAQNAEFEKKDKTLKAERTQLESDHKKRMGEAETIREKAETKLRNLQKWAVELTEKRKQWGKLERAQAQLASAESRLAQDQDMLAVGQERLAEDRQRLEEARRNFKKQQEEADSREIQNKEEVAREMKEKMALMMGQIIDEAVLGKTTK